MALVKFEPLKDLELFSNNIRRFFEDFPALNWDFGFSTFPKMDVWEDDKHLYFEAEIPGMSKKDIKISLEDNILTIKGERNQEKESKNKNYIRQERTYGSFQRSFTLPSEVNPDKIDARFDDGVLKISIEKTNVKPANQKLIEIK